MPDQVLIPCGGGGLSSGCALALKSRLPDARVYAVEPEDFDDTARSFETGIREPIDESARSICDALQSPMPGELTFEINRRLLAGVLTVSDDEVRAAIRFAFRNLKLVVEPGGAVALAAVLSGKIRTAGKTTAIVLSGGNIDVGLFAEIQAGTFHSFCLKVMQKLPSSFGVSGLNIIDSDDQKSLMTLVRSGYINKSDKELNSVRP